MRNAQIIREDKGKCLVIFAVAKNFTAECAKVGEVVVNVWFKVSYVKFARHKFTIDGV